ncbi:MAG: ferritin-like domain-containing protein [Chitinophagaceae bacterium]|nr:ferritin-like domain-containing protein [Oligoflexus sp.]
MKSKVLDSINRVTDDVLNDKESKVEGLSRRIWAQNFALITASAGVAWACGSSKGGSDAVAATTYALADQKSDAATMNIALGLELEAIAIYTAAAGLNVWDTSASGLAPTFLAVAKVFLGHHTAHRDALTAQINLLSAATAITPVTAKTTTEYLAPYPGIATLSGADGLLTVLQVAAEREMNAANAYFSVIKSFKNVDLMQTLGGLSADESGHYGVLNAAAFAHAFLIGKTADTKLDQTLLISGALPPFTYPRKVRS